jgi:hypothetical protein
MRALNVPSDYPMATPDKPAGKRHPVLLVATLIGLHIDIAAALPEGSIPNVLAAVPGLLLFASHLDKLPARFLAAVVAMTSFFFLSAVYAIGIQGGGAGPFIAIGLLLYSVAIATGVYIDLSLRSMDQTRRVAGWLVSGMLVFAILETYTPVQQFALWFGQYYSFDINIDRDLFTFGGYRPRLLTSEPSRAAIGLATAMGVWVLCIRRWDPISLGKLGFFTLIALYVVRSPFVVLPAMLCGARLTLWASGDETRNAASMAGRFVMLLIATAGVMVLIVALLGTVFSTRIESFSAQSDWSVTVRTYGSVLAGWESSLQRPIFGTGLDNFDAGRAEIASTYRQLGVPSYVTETDLLEISINNGFAVALIFFGFVGSAIYLWIWGGLMRSLAPLAPALLRWFVLFCTWLSYSAIYSPSVLGMAFILLAALQLAARARIEDAGDDSGGLGAPLLQAGTQPIGDGR